EGLLYSLKHCALAIAAHRRFVLEDGERVILSELHYDLGDKGTVRNSAARIKLAVNLLFTFRTFAKVNGTTYEATVSDHGWECFNKTIRVRDRLMHPKTCEALIIT